MSNGIVESSEVDQWPGAEPMVGGGIVWLQLDRALELANGSSEIDFGKVQHLADCGVRSGEPGLEPESFERGLFGYPATIALGCGRAIGTETTSVRQPAVGHCKVRITRDRPFGAR